MNANVKLVWITPDAEKQIAYIARVSNPANQNSSSIKGLLSYLIKHKHWSPFEMANMCVEIKTTRDISAQIIRHRSFSFQEFSQRYAAATKIENSKPRRQDVTNRQNSIDDLPQEVITWFSQQENKIHNLIHETYSRALELGIAKECARRLLPMSTHTTIYMNGTIRSWLHYFNLRCDEATQLEHRLIAKDVRDLFIEHFPVLGGLV